MARPACLTHESQHGRIKWEETFWSPLSSARCHQHQPHFIKMPCEHTTNWLCGGMPLTLTHLHLLLLIMDGQALRAVLLYYPPSSLKTSLWHRRNCSQWLNVGVTVAARAPQGDVDASLKALDVHCSVCAKEVGTAGTVTEGSASQMDCDKHALFMLPVCKWIGWPAPLHQCKLCAFSEHIPLIQFYHGFAYTMFVFDSCINSKIWYISYTARLKIMWSLYAQKFVIH